MEGFIEIFPKQNLTEWVSEWHLKRLRRFARNENYPLVMLPALPPIIGVPENGCRFWGKEQPLDKRNFDVSQNEAPKVSCDAARGGNG